MGKNKVKFHEKLQAFYFRNGFVELGLVCSEHENKIICLFRLDLKASLGNLLYFLQRPS